MVPSGARGKRQQQAQQTSLFQPHVCDLSSSVSFDNAGTPTGRQRPRQQHQQQQLQHGRPSTTPMRFASAPATPLESNRAGGLTIVTGRCHAVASRPSSRLGPDDWHTGGRAISSESISRPPASAAPSELAVATPSEGARGRSSLSRSTQRVHLPGNVYRQSDPASSWGFAPPSPSPAARSHSALSMSMDGGLLVEAARQYAAVVDAPPQPRPETSPAPQYPSPAPSTPLHHPHPHAGQPLHPTPLARAGSAPTLAVSMSSPSLDLARLSTSAAAEPPNPPGPRPTTVATVPSADTSLSTQGRFFELLFKGRPQSQQQQRQEPRPHHGDAPALQRTTLNGFGHSASRLGVSVPRIAKEGAAPRDHEHVISSPRKEQLEPQVLEVATRSNRQSTPDEGLSILLSSPHWRNRASVRSLVSPSGPRPVGEEREGSGGELGEAGGLGQGELGRKGEVSKVRQQLVPPPTKQNGPLGEDTLNLWRGKRLTLAEQKVEQQLHALRMNPTAKANLEKRVTSYTEEKLQKSTEAAAKAREAAERQEQRALMLAVRLGHDTSTRGGKWAAGKRNLA